VRVRFLSADGPPRDMLKDIGPLVVAVWRGSVAIYIARVNLEWWVVEAYLFRDGGVRVPPPS
jgi:hypothetical protein